MDFTLFSILEKIAFISSSVLSLLVLLFIFAKREVSKLKPTLVKTYMSTFLPPHPKLSHDLYPIDPTYRLYHLCKALSLVRFFNFNAGMRLQQIMNCIDESNDLIKKVGTSSFNKETYQSNLNNSLLYYFNLRVLTDLPCKSRDLYNKAKLDKNFIYDPIEGFAKEETSLAFQKECQLKMSQQKPSNKTPRNATQKSNQ